VADEFVPALDTILARRPAVEHIVIETSGLALPKPLVQAFHWPSIKSRVTVDGVIAVVDGAALADGRVAADLDALARQRGADAALDHDDPIEEVFEDQIACADLVVLNKRDLLDASGLDTAVAAVARAAARRQGRDGGGRQGRPGRPARPRRRDRERHREPPHPSRRRGRPSTTTSSRASRGGLPDKADLAVLVARVSTAAAAGVLRIKGFRRAGKPMAAVQAVARASRIITTGRGRQARRAPARSSSSG
jgi:cobalamin biosynthesis protein CobW